MKALSVTPEWAMPILLGAKTVEWRSWKTSYRGDLLICASSKPKPGYISGRALCVVTLTDIEPFFSEHLVPAMMDYIEPGYAWVINDLRWIKPFEVKGKLHLYDVPDDRIEYIPESIPDQEAFRRFYLPHVNMGRGDQWRKVWQQNLSEMAS